MAGICDVCGLDVSQGEDATHLDAVAHDASGFVFVSLPRHVRCSPSRAATLQPTYALDAMMRKRRKIRAYTTWNKPLRRELDAYA
jgi:hypothetical protein